MLYVTAGKGSMPSKEAVSVLTQLLENEERKAVENDLPEVSFWLAVDPYFIDTANNPHWQAVEQWCNENDVYVEETSDIYTTVKSARDEGEDVAILALPVSPYFTNEQDVELRRNLLNVRDRFPEVPVWAFNNQMYEALPLDHPEPVAPFNVDVETAAAEALETLAEQGKVFKDPSDGEYRYVWTHDELNAKSRDDLKEIAKNMSAVPKDLRSKDSIIEAILGRVSPEQTFDTPMGGEVQEPVDNDGTDSNATGGTLSEAELEQLVEDTVKRVLQAVLMEALARAL